MGIDIMYESMNRKSVDILCWITRGFELLGVSPSPMIPHTPPCNEMLVNDGWSSGLNLQGISREKK